MLRCPTAISKLHVLKALLEDSEYMDDESRTACTRLEILKLQWNSSNIDYKVELQKISAIRSYEQRYSQVNQSSRLHHILSFLDTKLAVRTSVLSRSWRHVWKHIHALNLHSDSFPNTSSFVRFVKLVLLLRYELELSEVSFIDVGISWNTRTRNRRLKWVIRNALSNFTQHLVVNPGMK
ncbi:F-box protein At1g60400 [Linum perenne]